MHITNTHSQYIQEIHQIAWILLALNSLAQIRFSSAHWSATQNLRAFQSKFAPLQNSLPKHHNCVYRTYVLILVYLTLGSTFVLFQFEISKLDDFIPPHSSDVVSFQRKIEFQVGSSLSRSEEKRI